MNKESLLSLIAEVSQKSKSYHIRNSVKNIAKGNFVFDDHSLTELDLSFCYIGDQGVKLLLQSGVLKTVKKLNLSWNNITSKSSPSLLRSNSLKNLHTLQLQSNKIGDQGLIALAKNPYANGLEYLNLDGNDFAFDGNDIGYEGISAFAMSSYLQNLQYLNLGWCKIEDQGLNILTMSYNSENLRYLKVHGNNISDEGILALTKSKGIRNLRHLDLNKNFFLSAAAAITLANCSYLAHLQYLDISNTNIKNRGAVYILQSPYLVSLKELHLQNIQAHSGLGKYIADCCNLVSLEKLSLGYNRLTYKDLKDIIQSPYTKKLQELCLEHNHISENLDSLMENSGVAKLNLSYNKFRELPLSQENLKKFQYLDLEGNEIDNVELLDNSPNQALLPDMKLIKELGYSGLYIKRWHMQDASGNDVVVTIHDTIVSHHTYGFVDLRPYLDYFSESFQSLQERYSTIRGLAPWLWFKNIPQKSIFVVCRKFYPQRLTDAYPPEATAKEDGSPTEEIVHRFFDIAAAMEMLYPESYTFPQKDNVFIHDNETLITDYGVEELQAFIESSYFGPRPFGNIVIFEYIPSTLGGIAENIYHLACYYFLVRTGEYPENIKYKSSAQKSLQKITHAGEREIIARGMLLRGKPFSCCSEFIAALSSL